MMALHLTPDAGDPGEPHVRLGRTGGAAVGEDRRLVRDGMQVLAWGALACPSCGLPLAPPPRIPPRAILHCGFCDHSATAIEFMQEGLVDTPANDAVLVARYG
jgi:hypothetical protein